MDAVQEKAVFSRKSGGNAKYQRIATRLKERIAQGTYPVGTPLPTMEALGREFGASLGTVFRAVQTLSEDNLISTASRRSGAVVQHKTPPRSKTIACLLRPPNPRNDEDNFALDIIEGLRDEISSRECRFIYHGLDETDYERRVIEAVELEGAFGILLDQKTPLPAARRLCNLRVPAVMLNRCEDVPGLSTVSLDFDAMTRATVRLFRKHGYERVGFYKMPHGEDQLTPEMAAACAPVFEMRSAFLAAAEGYSGDQIVLLPEPAETRLSEEPATFGLPLRRPDDWRSLAVMTASDTNALHMLSALRKTDLVLGKDVGVVGCYDLESGRHSPTPPSTWRIDGRAIGAVAVRELLARVEQPDTPPSRIHLPLEFVDRGTA